MIEYQLALSKAAREQVLELRKDRRRQIGQRLTLPQNNLTGDVKKLNAVENKYRPRVGKFRVLFRLEDDLIAVYSVKDRKEAYE